ncbi:hypothetical protein EV356DRAFT_566382 [Viridothelium virens]|uniref:AA1-like domain-containing protein n=1 Tax=Viridothelium virens TaxID=1048519 RepID=A0A6A6HBS6_VIRVR|nr:hypothetical protein EV356DRAFT_566382 [Viridothelium virens]
MQYFTIAATLLAAVVSAAPTTKRDDVYREVGLSFRSLGPNGEIIGEPAPLQLYTLTNVDNTSAYEIIFDGSSSNIDINTVECQAYKDADGTQIGSAPFTLASPAELATPNNPVEVGSVVCYVASNVNAD